RVADPAECAAYPNDFIGCVSASRGTGRTMMAEPQVIEHDDRFELYVDGEIAGSVSYRDWYSQRMFIHAEIGSKWGGQGLGSTLLKGTLDSTIAAGKRIVAVCDFVAGYVDRHDEYTDSVDKVTPEITTWLRGVKR